MGDSSSGHAQKDHTDIGRNFTGASKSTGLTMGPSNAFRHSTFWSGGLTRQRNGS